MLKWNRRCGMVLSTLNLFCCSSTACHLPNQVEGWAGYLSVLDWLLYKDTQEWIASIKSIYGTQELLPFTPKKQIVTKSIYGTQGLLPSTPKKQMVTATLRNGLCYQIHWITKDLKEGYISLSMFLLKQSALTHVEDGWRCSKGIGQKNVTRNKTKPKVQGKAF